MSETKTCNRCQEEKPLTEFYKHSQSGGHHYKCKACFRLLKTLGRFNLTEEQFAEMHEVQGFACAICKSTDPGGRSTVNNFCVDHDHETGKVRGLLCHSCNLALGHFKDNVATIESAILYLNKNG